MRDTDDESRPHEGDVKYEGPKVTPIGNLRDLLAGTGTQPCDSTIPQPGPDDTTVCN
jgi:hypothetical protein